MMQVKLEKEFRSSVGALLGDFKGERGADRRSVPHGDGVVVGQRGKQGAKKGAKKKRGTEGSALFNFVPANAVRPAS
ncbi:hypothetical protein [Accumulibacter sp.]|uniref:hypothetical protein n=1 Tax=Accumulibacter sp. TaxID=2053492 RepID=UPI00262614FA|nr:hypothetical protein [Accumulibacter sp.]